MFEVEVDWTYGVHLLIVFFIDDLGIPEELVKVISPTEVIIMNNPDQRHIFTTPSQRRTT